jgi:diguanylate cyclase (GGDEF)-like protein
MKETPTATSASDSARLYRPESEHRRSLLLLRWLMIILAAYLTVFRYLPTSNFTFVVMFVIAFALTNVLLTVITARGISFFKIQRALAVADVLFVAATFFLLRAPDTYIYLGFLLVFAMAAIWREFMVLLFSLVIVSLLYGACSAFRLYGFADLGTVEQFLTQALFFVVSVYYLFFSDSILSDSKLTAALMEEKRRADVMFEITRSISSSLNTQEILYLIVTRLSEVFEARDCSIVRVDAQTRTARMVVKSAEPKLPETNVDLEQYPELLMAFDSQEIVFVPSMTRGGSTQSVVAVPMRVKNTVLGLIYIRLNVNWLKLSEGDDRFFRVMSATAANALRNAEMFEEMEHRARTDFLTGLPNHRSFQSTLSTELGRAQRHNHPLSLLIIDLDFLKEVNDKFGHPTGDMVIRAIAETICKGCREFDVAARYGGEEFTVILPETPLEDASQVADRIREMIAEYEFPGVGTVTASIGVSNFPVNALGKEDLIRVADQALYVAKNNGRDRVAFFNYQLITR